MPVFNPGNHAGCIGDVAIASSDISQVVMVGAFILVAHTVFRHNGSKAVLEAINNRGPYTARRDAAQHNNCVNLLANHIGHDRGLKEDRGARFA